VSLEVATKGTGEVNQLSMETALYFPHATIEDPFLLKSALLLWDELEYISPGKWLQPETNDRNLLEAIELVGRPIFPNETVQDAVHDHVVKFFRNGVPEKYLPRPEGRMYHIYADKFAPKTWEFLCQLEVIDGRFTPIRKGSRHYDHRVGERLGVLLMAILVDEYAGRTARKVTDASFAQVTHAAVVARESGGQFGNLQPEHGTCIVKLLTPVLPLEDVSMSDLIRLRKNESAFLRSLRANYRAAVDEYIEAVGNDDNKQRDFIRIVDAFRRKMADDLIELDRVLGRRDKQTLLKTGGVLGGGIGAAYATYCLSQDVLAALAAGAAAIGVPKVFELLGSMPEAREKREKFLSDNRAAWLYEVRQQAGGRLPLTT
jgi:hypothetical protein